VGRKMNDIILKPVQIQTVDIGESLYQVVVKADKIQRIEYDRIIKESMKIKFLLAINIDNLFIRKHLLESLKETYSISSERLWRRKDRKYL
jgi:hypothetical protein